MDSAGKKALVPARGEAVLFVGNHSIQCQVTGVSLQHLVLASPEAADVGQFIRCMIKLEEIPQWIDGDMILIQQVQDLESERRIWTLQIQSLTPPGESVLEDFVEARRHVGTRTGAQPRVTPRTRPGVGAVGGATTTKPDTSRAGLYHHQSRRLGGKKTRTLATRAAAAEPGAAAADAAKPARGEAPGNKTRAPRDPRPQRRTLAEELKDYLEDSTPIEEIYASALEQLDKETKRR